MTSCMMSAVSADHALLDIKQSSGTGTGTGGIRKNNDDDDDDDIILQQMLEACTSVTGAALSCPTLGSAALVCRRISDGGGSGGGSGGGGGGGDSKSEDATRRGVVDAAQSAEYEDELEIGRWLDSQIMEYRAALKRHEEEGVLLMDDNKLKRSAEMASTGAGDSVSQSSTSNTTITAAAPSRKRRRTGSADAITRQKERELKRLREDLFDETIRVQQERLLLSRMRMSAAAAYTSFPDSVTGTGEASAASASEPQPVAAAATTALEEEEANALQLRREALRSRDDHVLSALGRVRDVDKLRTKLEAVDADCRNLQSENRNLWKRLTTSGMDDNDTSSSMSHGSDDLYAQSLQRENLVLRRALVETIAGSGIDWYGDERLSKTIQTLEE